jgi:hypothetical protein
LIASEEESLEEFEDKTWKFMLTSVKKTNKKP